MSMRFGGVKHHHFPKFESLADSLTLPMTGGLSHIRSIFQFRYEPEAHSVNGFCGVN